MSPYGLLNLTEVSKIQLVPQVSQRRDTWEGLKDGDSRGLGQQMPGKVPHLWIRAAHMPVPSAFQWEVSRTVSYPVDGAEQGYPTLSALSYFNYVSALQMTSTP